MSVKNDQYFWRGFIQLYKNFPGVWKVKSDLYKNRVLTQDAYEKLKEKLNTIDSNVDINITKKKINTLRSNYRRKLKKVLASKKSGAEVEDIYVPSLWYFEDLDFFRDHEIQIRSTSTMDDEDDIPLSVEHPTSDNMVCKLF